MSNIDFKIRRVSGSYTDVRVTLDGATSVDLGLHDQSQRKALACQLRDAADELDPPDEQESQ